MRVSGYQKIFLSFDSLYSLQWHHHKLRNKLGEWAGISERNNAPTMIYALITDAEFYSFLWEFTLGSAEQRGINKASFKKSNQSWISVQEEKNKHF